MTDTRTAWRESISSHAYIGERVSVTPEVVTGVEVVDLVVRVIHACIWRPPAQSRSR